MWPSSYWWRGIRRQRTGPEVKLLGCCCTCLLSFWKFLLWLVNQTCPLGFSAQEEKRQGDKVCVSVWIHACKHVHVFYFLDFHCHIICHRIIQRFHFSSKYLFIFPSVSLSPDVLLHKLVQALSDIFRSNLRKSHTVPNTLFFFFLRYLFYWTGLFILKHVFIFFLDLLNVYASWFLSDTAAFMDKSQFLRCLIWKHFLCLKFLCLHWHTFWIITTKVWINFKSKTCIQECRSTNSPAPIQHRW